LIAEGLKNAYWIGGLYGQKPFSAVSTSFATKKIDSLRDPTSHPVEWLNFQM
jgi:hypothetical protein